MTIYALFWSASLLTALGIRRRVATGVFLFVVFVFIGLRLDTGFDWPVYKSIFQDFQREFSLVRIAIYSQLYGQEPGFLFLLGLSSQYFQNFEVFQAFVTFTLLWSTALLTRTAGVKEVALVVAIAMTFLMCSVGFSILRQSLAISFFNFGLVCFLRKRPWWGGVLFFLSTMFQLSSVVYIVAYIVSRMAWRGTNPPAIGTFLIATLAASVMAPVGMIAISSVSSLAASKLEFYLTTQTLLSRGPTDLLFMLFFGAAALMVSGSMVKPGVQSPFANQLRRLIMVLAAIGVASSFLTVLRDRVSNELFILISVYLLMSGLRYRWYFVAFFVTFGLVNSLILIAPLPNNLAFAPYQNVIVSYVMNQPSTGPDRSAAFFQIFSEMNALLR